MKRLWFHELVAPDEVAFEADVFLLRKATAEALRTGVPAAPALAPEPEPGPGPTPVSPPDTGGAAAPATEPGVQTRTIRLVGAVPPEVWNRLGTKILPKLRSGSDLKIGVDFTVAIRADSAASLVSELRQALQELGLAEAVRVE